jgi:hypothetical protein
MGIRAMFERARRTIGGEPHADGKSELHVGDPAYDDWDVVADFEELETARAFRQTLTEAGRSSALTADWPLDRFGRGDIALRVPPGEGLAAEELLDEPG